VRLVGGQKSRLKSIILLLFFIKMHCVQLSTLEVKLNLECLQTGTNLLFNQSLVFSKQFGFR